MFSKAEKALVELVELELELALVLTALLVELELELALVLTALLVELELELAPAFTKAGVGINIELLIPVELLFPYGFAVISLECKRDCQTSLSVWPSTMFLSFK